MTPEQMKKWIDDAGYEELLRRWRFAPVGDPIFQGEIGDYYKKVMDEKRAKLSDGMRVFASKAVGWERP